MANVPSDLTSMQIEYPHFDPHNIPTVLLITLIRQRGIPQIKTSGHITQKLQQAIKHIFQQYKLSQRVQKRTTYTKFSLDIYNPLEYDIGYDQSLLTTIDLLLKEDLPAPALPQKHEYTKLKEVINNLFQPLGQHTFQYSNSSNSQQPKATTLVITDRYELKTTDIINILHNTNHNTKSQAPYKDPTATLVQGLLSKHLHIRYRGVYKGKMIIYIRNIKPIYEQLLRLKPNIFILSLPVTEHHIDLIKPVLEHYQTTIAHVPPCKCGQYLLSSRCICSRLDRRRHLYKVISPILETNNIDSVILYRAAHKQNPIKKLKSSSLYRLYL